MVQGKLYLPQSGQQYSFTQHVTFYAVLFPLKISLLFYNGRHSSIITWCSGMNTALHCVSSILRNASNLLSHLLCSSTSGSIRWIIVLMCSKRSRLMRVENIGVHRRLAFWAIHFIRWFMIYTQWLNRKVVPCFIHSWVIRQFINRSITHDFPLNSWNVFH